jgi:hypothetical protein
VDRFRLVRLARILGAIIFPLWLTVYLVIAIGDATSPAALVIGIANLFVGLLVGWLWTWSPGKKNRDLP